MKRFKVYGLWSMVFFIAWRLLFFSRQKFVPLLSAITLLSITLGVFCLVVVLSVMRGFQQELNHRWIGLSAHLTVSGFDLEKTIQAWPEVDSVQKYFFGEVIVESHSGPEKIAVAAKLKGYDSLNPDFLRRVRFYPSFAKATEGRPSFAQDWTLMGGEELLSVLGASPDFSEPLTLLYPFGEIGPTGDWVPRQLKLKVSHAFQTGLYAWDAYTILVPLAKAQQLLGERGEAGLQIRLKDLKFLSRIETRLKKIVPPKTTVESFAEQNSRLFAALRLERLTMTLLLSLFLLIASFSIGGLLLMFLSSKQRDLAILRAIGLNPAQAKKLYLTLGMWLGGLGGVLGLTLGGIASWLLVRYPIHLPPTYYLEFLPVKLEWFPLLTILVLSLGLALVSAWYPARLASRLPILPMLREE